MLRWLLVVALIAPLLVGDDLVGAQKAETTDTTTVVGTDSQARDHVSGERPPNCSHGEVTINPGTPNEQVRCRACARRTYYSSGGRCRAVNPTPACEDLGLVNYAIVSSWSHCVPIYCPTFGNPPEDQDEWRDLSTGDCIDKCPSGKRWSTTRRRCVTIPTTTTPTTTMVFTGTPNDLEHNPTIVDMPCGSYSAEQEAGWYINTGLDSTLINPNLGLNIHFEVLMETYPGKCPPSGLFEAGIDRHNAKPQSTVDEHYTIQWAYDARIWVTHGLVAVKPGGELVTPHGPRDSAPSDGCTDVDIMFGPFKIMIETDDENEPTWDFRVPCGAHDYCVSSLVGFALSRHVSKTDCDDTFNTLMRANCLYRSTLLQRDCNSEAGTWYGAVSLIGKTAEPGTVRIVNVQTGLCMTARSVSESEALGYRVFQQVCGSPYQTFQFEHALVDRFRVRNIGTNYCLGRDVLTPSIVATGFRCADSPVSLVNDDGTDRYLIRGHSVRASNYCWAPVANSGATGAIQSQSCDTTDDRFLWYLEEVG